MIVLKNWSVRNHTSNPCHALELGRYVLCGNVYKHSRFDDGDPVTTSTIVSIDEDSFSDCKVIKTRSGSEYRIYPEDIDSELEKEFPDYYNRMSIN